MRNENANAISQENGFAIIIFCPTSHRSCAVPMKNGSAMIFVHGCITGESCGPFWKMVPSRVLADVLRL